jgi:hypothetical protein
MIYAKNISMQDRPAEHQTRHARVRMLGNRHSECPRNSNG